MFIPMLRKVRRNDFPPPSPTAHAAPGQRDHQSRWSGHRLDGRRRMGQAGRRLTERGSSPRPFPSFFWWAGAGRGQRRSQGVIVEPRHKRLEVRDARSIRLRKTYNHYVIVEAVNEEEAAKRATAIPLEEWDEIAFGDWMDVKKSRTAKMPLPTRRRCVHEANYLLYWSEELRGLAEAWTGHETAEDRRKSQSNSNPSSLAGANCTGTM